MNKNSNFFIHNNSSGWHIQDGENPFLASVKRGTQAKGYVDGSKLNVIENI
jgi:hypothetical protein